MLRNFPILSYCWTEIINSGFIKVSLLQDSKYLLFGIPTVWNTHYLECVLFGILSYSPGFTQFHWFHSLPIYLQITHCNLEQSIASHSTRKRSTAIYNPLLFIWLTTIDSSPLKLFISRLIHTSSNFIIAVNYNKTCEPKTRLAGWKPDHTYTVQLAFRPFQYIECHFSILPVFLHSGHLIQSPCMLWSPLLIPNLYGMRDRWSWWRGRTARFCRSGGPRMANFHRLCRFPSHSRTIEG